MRVVPASKNAMLDLMSNSRRHSPFVGNTTAPSDKAWKAQAARKTRRAVNQALAGLSTATRCQASGSP